MTIGAELEAQILRYYHVEKWRCGTIARQLHVHRGTVQRVLAQAGLPRIGGMLRPSQIDAYLPFIHETLRKFPSLTASRLYAMVTERGYRGNLHHFRHQVAFNDGQAENEYSRNVQISDLNCLNATLAVIKWKKLRGYFHDFSNEHYSSYTIEGNRMAYEDMA